MPAARRAAARPLCGHRGRRANRDVPFVPLRALRDFVLNRRVDHRRSAQQRSSCCPCRPIQYNARPMAKKPTAPKVAILMGSASDLEAMKKAAEVLAEFLPARNFHYVRASRALAVVSRAASRCRSSPSSSSMRRCASVSERVRVRPSSTARWWRSVNAARSAVSVRRRATPSATALARAASSATIVLRRSRSRQRARSSEL